MNSSHAGVDSDIVHTKTLILSDTHLGAERGAARSPKALRPLWQGCDRVVINGDVAEVHDPKLRADSARIMIELQELLEQDQVELTLLSGNHDAYLTDLRHLSLESGQVLVMHGDALHPAIAPWFPMWKKLQSSFENALKQGDLEERAQPRHPLAVSQYVSHDVVWRHEDIDHNTSYKSLILNPLNAARLLWYWRNVPVYASRFADKYAPAARFILIGHTHHQGIWRTGKRVVINTGSFGFPGKPRAVTLERGRLSVFAIEDAGDAYALSAKPIESFDLDAAAGEKPGTAA